MEQIAPLLVSAGAALAFVRLMAMPLKGFVKLGLHALGGFACLWLLNLTYPVTGIALPVNAVTVLAAGVLGLPGIGVIALLAAW